MSATPHKITKWINNNIDPDARLMENKTTINTKYAIKIKDFNIPYPPIQIDEILLNFYSNNRVKISENCALCHVPLISTDT